MYDWYQSHAPKTRLAVPLLCGVNAIQGTFSVLRSSRTTSLRSKRQGLIGPSLRA
jgi:hypothetical protein